MPASTKVQLANIALRRIGVKKTIANLSDGSPEAALINLYWEHSLGVAFEHNEWVFTERRAVLVLDSEAPPAEWGYAYLVPTDCLVPRMIEDERKDRRVEERVPFLSAVNSIGMRVIYTDMSDASLRYSAYVDNENLWSRTFGDYFAWLLASEIAISESLSDSIRQRAFAGREWAFGRAWEVDARSKQSPAPAEAEWHQARHGTPVEDPWRAGRWWS